MGGGGWGVGGGYVVPCGALLECLMSHFLISYTNGTESAPKMNTAFQTAKSRGKNPCAAIPSALSTCDVRGVNKVPPFLSFDSWVTSLGTGVCTSPVLMCAASGHLECLANFHNL